MPSYQFNNFTGRLKESTHFQPLYPISATPLNSSEPPNMIYDSVKTVPVVCNARSSSSGANHGGVLPAKMLKTFEFMQKNIETPVYIIKGTPDKILMGVCYTLTAVCLAFSAQFVYSQAFKGRK